MVPVRSDITRAAPALVLVVPIVIAGLVGGRVAALVVVPAAALAFNVVFIPPHWTLKIDALDDAVALAVFGLVAIVVGTLVAREGERRTSAEERAAELQELNKELQAVQRERERLAEEATRAAVLEKVDEQRAALLRSVSHDLRTPLATVRAVVSDLLGGAPYDDVTQDELLTLVAEETERLDRLVANLLSLSRIEAGALHPERQAVAMEELVAHMVKRLDRLFGTCQVRVELPADLPLVPALVAGGCGIGPIGGEGRGVLGAEPADHQSVRPALAECDIGGLGCHDVRDVWSGRLASTSLPWRGVRGHVHAV